ncbi:MAG: sugar transferase [Candidatus Omnitrophica bacterium]|nr:sugar transferase [Candidatus Omnitrophota bacterium]
MIKEKVAILKKLMILFDVAVVSLAFLLAYRLAYYLREGLNPLGSYLVLLPLVVLIWAYFLNFLGLYASFRTKNILDIILIIFQATFFALAIFGSMAYLFKLQDVSRIFITTIFLLGGTLLVLEKILLILFFRFFRKKGFNTRNMLVVGTGKRAEQFIRLLDQHSEWGLRVLGVIDEDEAKINETIEGAKVIGSFRDFAGIIHKNVVDQVVFIVPRGSLDKIQELVYFCETEGITASVAVNMFDLKFSRARQTDLHGFPLVSFESVTDKLWHLLAKRVFDIIFSSLGLLILSPVFLAVSALIKITSAGPVFFRQERSGFNGRKFTLYKFRTMIKDAEEKLHELREKNEMNGPVFKLKNDPRITPIGRFLRKFSVDELPQLWNVLKGDMSIVGPRPPLPQEVEKYDNWQRRRLNMRPGVTCFWQVNGRNKITDFNEWMKLDLEYIDNWSLLLDARILLKTVPVVLLGIGDK